jgi:flagellin
MSVLRINQNPIALNANRNLKITGMAISRSLERLSSGMRINRAADDAAGLSISEKLRGQIRGLNRASSNAMDGISLIQTAEGALDEMHTILQRMRELSVQAANGIYTAGDRQSLQLEVSQLTDEINRIANTTEFNTKRLLDGTMGALISTDDFTRIRAAVTGNVGAGGNFVLKCVAKSTGQLQVMKTDVFTTAQTVDAVGRLNYLAT